MSYNSHHIYRHDCVNYLTEDIRFRVEVIHHYIFNKQRIVDHDVFCVLVEFRHALGYLRKFEEWVKNGAKNLTARDISDVEYIFELIVDKFGNRYLPQCLRKLKYSNRYNMIGRHLQKDPSVFFEQTVDFYQESLNHYISELRENEDYKNIDFTTLYFRDPPVHSTTKSAAKTS